MNEHIFKLETSCNYLDRAKALLALMTDYFGEVDPEAAVLLNRYEVYRELNHAIHDIICKAVELRQELVKVYYDPQQAQDE